MLAVALVFAQSANHEFVNFDDPEYVQDNSMVARGVTADGIAWAFSFHNGNWHPLTWLSHKLDCEVYGLDRAVGHHLTSVVLHAINTLLLFLILRNMTGDLWPAAFAAALFSIHPLHVESVAWISERKDVLSALFFMFSLATYVAYARRPFSIIRYLLVTLAFVLGLMAKSMLVTLPFVFVLLDYWPLGRRGPIWPRWVEKLPWLALSAVSCVVTYFAQAATESVWERLSLSTRLGNALISYVVYLRQFVYPAGLAAFYPHPQDVAPLWHIADALILLAAITAALLAWRRKAPYLLVGWLWYLGMLVPVVGLVQVGAQARADRYSYLPQIGLYIAIAWGFARVAVRRDYRSLVFSSASTVIISILTFTAWRQAAYWRNGVALWSRVVACTESNSWPHNNLGAALAASGKMEEAAGEFREAVSIDPNDEEAHFNLALILNREKNIDGAIEEFRQVLRIKPNDALTHGDLGALLFGMGRLDEAIEHLQTAQRLDPNDANARAYLSIALAARQELAKPQGLPPRSDPH